MYSKQYLYFTALVATKMCVALCTEVAELPNMPSATSDREVVLSDWSKNLDGDDKRMNKCCHFLILLISQQHKSIDR